MKYNIDRFVQMHKMYYPDALKEIKNGYKMTHWMWYIFPQLKGLGHSYKAEYYGLDGVEEAIEYMKNEYLKNNMLEICSELIKVDDDVKYIFGYPDFETNTIRNKLKEYVELGIIKEHKTKT